MPFPATYPFVATVRGTTRPRMADNGFRAETYSLCVDLVDIGQPFCKNIAWHFIAKLVPEFRSFPTSTVDRCTSIGYGAGHDTAH